MGTRGRNKKGFYIALLFALNLQYEKESREKGEGASAWHPSPRNRPDHFLYWVHDVLKMLGADEMDSFGELLEQLRLRQLQFVERVLRYSVERQLRVRYGGSLDVRSLSLQRLEEVIGTRGSAPERHPQVRKFAHVVSKELDQLWANALAATAREYSQSNEQPGIAMLLGGLPPAFDVINLRIFELLSDAELLREHRSLTVMQFYGLVTGTLPAPTDPLRDAVEWFGDLREADIHLLCALSDNQLVQLRNLGEVGWMLVFVRQRLHCSATDWLALGAELTMSESRSAIGMNSELARFQSAVDRVIGPALGRATIFDLARHRSCWNAVGALDEELNRLILRRELRVNLHRRLCGWEDHTWREVRQFLARERNFLVEFLEDRRVLSELYQYRTTARLNLRDLFPMTVQWLDGWLAQYLDEALVQDVGELESDAARISSRVKENLWSRLRAIRGPHVDQWSDLFAATAQ